MVAITVILAAVIGTFVLGLGDSVQSNVQAGASIQATEGGTDGSVTVTFNSNQNAGQLNVSFRAANGTELSTGGGYLVDGSTIQYTSGSSQNVPAVLGSVGSSVTLSEDLGSAAETDVRVQVTAIGEDGETRTVILDKTVTI
jgi:FlaG/FlaF family flagellin (archaellin)